MKKKFTILALIAALVMSMFVMGACGSSDDSNDDAAKDEASGLTGTVTVAAAASLENTMVDQLIPLFNKTNPDVKIEGTYDSSGKLQEQIEGGLEAGVFMSAATKQMDALIEGQFVDEANVADVLQNEVVLIKAKDSDTEVDSYENITKAKTIAIGDPASVPAGEYAEEILKNLDVWSDVEAKASLGTNVTEVLNWVAEGSAEVGIVYKTDALSMTDKVEVIENAPEGSLETPVVYPIGMLNKVADENADATKAFFEFLQSNEALAIFEEAGFTIVDQADAQTDGNTSDSAVE